MNQSRVKKDVLAQAGYGFPVVFTLALIAGAFAANVTGVGAVALPTNLAVPNSGPNNASTLTISHISVFIGTNGNETTGTYSFVLNQVDPTGLIVQAVLANFTVPAAGGLTLVSLLDSYGNGIKVPAGSSLRLDTGAAASGGSTLASNIKLDVIGQMFGISL